MTLFDALNLFAPTDDEIRAAYKAQVHSIGKPLSSKSLGSNLGLLIDRAIGFRQSADIIKGLFHEEGQRRFLTIEEAALFKTMRLARLDLIRATKKAYQ